MRERHYIGPAAMDSVVALERSLRQITRDHLLAVLISDDGELPLRKTSYVVTAGNLAGSGKKQKSIFTGRQAGSAGVTHSNGYLAVGVDAAREFYRDSCSFASFQIFGDGNGG